MKAHRRDFIKAASVLAGTGADGVVRVYQPRRSRDLADFSVRAGTGGIGGPLPPVVPRCSERRERLPPSRAVDCHRRLFSGTVHLANCGWRRRSASQSSLPYYRTRASTGFRSVTLIGGRYLGSAKTKSALPALRGFLRSLRRSSGTVLVQLVLPPLLPAPNATYWVPSTA